MKNKLKIHKLNNYSRGIILTEWLGSNEIVNDTSYTEVEADFQANQIILTLPPLSYVPQNQISNKFCETKEREERHWTELSQEELEAKYPDYPTCTAKDTALLERKFDHMINDLIDLDSRVDALSATVKTLQVSKKGETV
jgi:Zn-finger domain-containing protein